MSLTTMTSGRSLSTAMLLIASHAMPPVSAPSPMTATVCRSRLAAQPVRLGDAVGPGQRGRGVGVLDDVVLGLGPARVAREAALLLEPAEVVPAGEQLVHVGLVAGVEDDRVARRVEDPVQRDGQLDHAEVGPEVPAGLGDGVDEEGPDLLGQGGQLLRRQGLEVIRTVDRVQHVHDQVVLPHRESHESMS